MMKLKCKIIYVNSFRVNEIFFEFDFHFFAIHIFLTAFVFIGFQVDSHFMRDGVKGRQKLQASNQQKKYGYQFLHQWCKNSFR